MGDHRATKRPEFCGFFENHTAMLAAYRQQGFKIAAQWLDETETAARNVALGKVHALYRNRVAKPKQHPPPADWGGVYIATEE